MKVFTEKDLQEFIAIWKEEFGEDITPDRAQAEAENLLQVVYQLRTIYQRGQRSLKEMGTSSGESDDISRIHTPYRISLL